MSDLFDEFEFKPLTEGLGFHKKTTAQASTKTPDLKYEPAKKQNLPEIESPDFLFEKEAAELTPPLPRSNHVSKPAPIKKPESQPTQSSATIDQVLKSLNQKRPTEFIEPVKHQQTEELISWSMGSFVLDQIMILAFSLLMVISLIVITHVDLLQNLTQPTEGSILYASLVGLYLAVMWIYYTACRIYMGHTLGEWAFDIELGTEEQQASPFYGLKVIFRSLLILFSGGILFPILSLIFGRDLVGQLSGAKLCQQIK